ncbi:MAG: PorV/PorQ family protein [Candidatus Latescibacter sp.]|nr:PorV/PorQ family protein [Candidatus Latescibacter sp.]
MMRIFVFLAASCAILSAGVSNVLSEQVYSDSGRTGLSFLRVTPTARIASLGGAGLSSADGPSSEWLNPSLIAFVGERSAQFSHTEWIQGIKQEYAAVSANSAAGAFGFSVQIFDSGDIELRGSAPSETSPGTYSIKNVSLAFTYARLLTQKISLGVTYKKLFEKIAQENAGGYAVDGGITWRPMDGLALAAVARNYGEMGILKNERTKIPSDVSMGFLYSGMLPGFNRNFTLLGDYVIPRYGDNGIRTGVEVEAVDRFFIRIGYRNDSSLETMSYGLGLEMGIFSADVSYTPIKDFPDNALRFTLSITGF